MSSSTPNRVSVTTINRDGSRNFLHPADVSGVFTTLRRWVAWGIMVLFVALPWIPVNGHPALFLDVAARRFHLFGATIVAQDLWIMFFFITGLGFSLFFITSLLGRVWCGWTCPQTVFLEHVFRRIERFLEGDHVAQKKLDALDWGHPEKLRKRGVKMGIFFLLCLAISHIFLAYFVSWPRLYSYMAESPFAHLPVFLIMAAITVILFVNFTWFREQLCLIICPYGRFQSALIDDDSIIIGYDEKRGEPRGPAKKEGAGDCIDCNRCVQVCPTGIDIRQGLQMECIGCANCIDACDAIMAKLGRPKGLVRYDSTNGLAGGKHRWLRPRILFYAVMMLIGFTVMLSSLRQIEPVFLNVTRMAGSPYVVNEQGIRNQYQLRLINKLEDSVTLRVELHGAPEGFSIVGLEDALELAPMEEISRPFVIQARVSDYQGKFTARVIAVTPDGKTSLQKDFEFVGPSAERLHERYPDA